MVTSSDKLVTGDGRAITVEEVAKVYRECFNVATPSSGRIKRLSDNSFSVTGVFNTLDADIVETVKTSRLYSVKTQNGRVASGELVADNLAADLTSVSSNNNRFVAKLKSLPNGKDGQGKKQLLEIWDKNKHLKTIDVSEIEAHGPINTDNKFSSFQWSPFGEQDKLLYVCQRKQPKSLNFFKQEKPKTGPAEGKAAERGTEYDYVEGWGELLSEVSHTLVGIIDVSNNFQVTTVDLDGYSLAETRWLDDGRKIVSTAYLEEPRRLGLHSCNNRPSLLVVYDIEASPPKLVLELKTEAKCNHTPRVDHVGKRFVFLKSEANGAHYHSVSLWLYDIETKEEKLLLDRLAENRDLFIETLLNNCFASDDKSIVFESAQQLQTSAHVLNLDNRKLRCLGTNMAIYDYKHDVLLFSKSSVNEFPNLCVGIVNPASEQFETFNLEDSHNIEDVKYEIEFDLKNSEGTHIGSSLLVWPNLDSDSLKNLPTIVLVHGGPHATFGSHYMPVVVFYARFGLKVILFNYRGSSGITEKFLQSLTGHIGNLDIADSLATIEFYVRNGKIRQDKLIVVGGSHGGFITCHLSCQDRYKFLCAIVRNPVINMTSMYDTTDIPDWVRTEILDHKQIDIAWRPNEADLARMLQVSPDHRKAQVPTLVLLGNKDRRVPMSQGLRWYEVLKAQGIETKCKVYADHHSLGKSEVQADSNIESAVWIMQHLP